MRPLVPIGPPRKNQGVDFILLTVILLLTIIGLVIVYSASSERSMADYGNPHKMFLTQFFRAIVGLGILAFMMYMPYHIWRKFAIPAILISALCLVLIFLSNLGVESHGARRWINAGPINFQPSEVAKFSIVLFLASWARTHVNSIFNFREGIFIPLSIAFILVAIIAMQPDFSTAAMIAAIAIIMVFISGSRLTHLAAVFGPLMLIASIFVWISPYRRARLLSYFSLGIDLDKTEYQVLQSWIGFGRGGLTGVGTGESRQKLFFLPDGHTDFIYSVIGEEWGFIGTLIVLLLFLVLIWRGLRIGFRCPDPFGGRLAIGFTFAIGLYALVNMAIAVGVLPTTGLPLPFISYGGTSLILTYAVSGVILNISHYGTPGKQMRTGGVETL